MDSGIFILYCGLESSTVITYFVRQLQLWLLGPPEVGSCLSDMSSLCVALSYFLVPQCKPSLSCIFPAPVLDLLVSPGSPHSFSWHMMFRDQDLGPGVLIAAEVLMLVAPLSGQS